MIRHAVNDKNERSIMKVSVISTGSVAIRPDHVRGRGIPMMLWLLTSRRWTAPRPINVYVIEHPDGLVLFDSGQDRRSVTDPDYFPKGIVGYLYGRLAKFTIGEHDTLTEQLAAIGYAAADVKTVVLSHLHQDHIGGIAELPNATIIVSAAEWRGLDSPFAELNGLLAAHIRRPGIDWMPVEPAPVADPSIEPFTSAVDLRGDGTLMLLPTPGHTPGSMSLLVRAPGSAPLLLVGDLTYDVNLLEHEQVPGVGHHRGLVESTRTVNRLRERYPDLVILAAHDPAAEGLLAAATVGKAAG
jgi:glyoxylase-like metal-dependent hydrolase (beta-lactamase superfamily II)